MRRILLASAVAVALVATAAPSSVLAQQPAAAAPAGPAVGDVAPDFTVTGVTKDGVLAAPIRLSGLRGQTVVVAFFPKARTSGCTVQMESYRDRYADLFNGGEGVTLLAVSTDKTTDLEAWAKEANFPMTFGSDVDGAMGRLFGANRGAMNDRSLFVIGPDGKIAYIARPFRQMAEEAYTDLGAAIDRLATKKVGVQ